MSEDETNMHDEEPDAATKVGGSEKNANVSSKKATGEGYSDQTDRELKDNAGSLTLLGQLSRVCTKDLSVLDFATPRARGEVMDHTPELLITTDGLSPLARFPIAVQPTHRLTPGTLTKRVVDDSGGQLLAEDTRQALLISSPSHKPHHGLHADLWDIDAESMVSELQPKPLQINRQRPRANTDDDRRWSRMFDELNADVPSTLGMIGISASIGRDKTMSHGFVSANDDDNDNDDRTATGSDRTPRALGTKIQNFASTTPAARGIQRSASTIITPTQSTRRLRHQASYNMENTEHSGFTPEHRHESVTHGTFPRSGVMLNLQDTQTRLRYPLQDSDEIQLSKSLDDVTPKARHFHDRPDIDRYKQNSVKEWVKSIAMTPRRHKAMPHNGTGDDRNHSIPGDQIASHSVWRQQDAQPFLTTSTRDFSQSGKIQKQRQKPKDTSSSTYRFPKQQFDTHSRAQSPLPPAGEKSFSHRRTPSPTEQHSTAVPKTPSSSIGSVLRRHIRSGHSTPATPRTPASPRLAWRPFDDEQPELPCSSPWLSSHRGIKREREERRAFFREKAERELEKKQSPKRSARKSSFGSVTIEDQANRSNLVLDNRMSKESLVAWRSFIRDAPEPLFSSPPPPIPPLPSGSQLNLALDRLQQARTVSQTAPGIEALPSTSYRARKPQGLRVDTDWARKATRDGARTPSRNTGATSVSGSSFRTALRLDVRQMSFGRAAAEEDRKVGERDDEVTSRRK